MLIQIDIDKEAYEHLLSDACEANRMKPCGFSEHVMAVLHDAVRREVHVFKPSAVGEDRHDWCERCGQNFRSLKHKRVK